MHNKKQEKQREAAPTQRNSAEEKLFRSADSKQDTSVAESLAKDQQFRKFFTTSVIEVPEEMRKVDRNLTDAEEPEEKKNRKKGGWLKNIFSVSEEEDFDEDEVDVRIPQQAEGQAQETEESFEEHLEPIEEETPAKKPSKAAQQPARQATERAHGGEHAARKGTAANQTTATPASEIAIQPQAKPKEPAAPLGQVPAPARLSRPVSDEKKPDEPDAQQVKPARENTLQAESPAAAAKKADAMPKNADAPQKAKKKTVDVGSLLEQIDEVQANVAGTGRETGRKAVQPSHPAQNSAVSAEPLQKADAEAQPKTVVVLEPSTEELADRTPNEEQTAQAKKAPQEAASVRLDADTGRKNAPTGRIVFADEETEAADGAAAQEKKAEAQPADNTAAQTQKATISEAEKRAGAADDTRVYAPQQDALEKQAAAQTKKTQPPYPCEEQAAHAADAANKDDTGEIAFSLPPDEEDTRRVEEPTGEVPLGAQPDEEDTQRVEEPTGEIPIGAQADEAPFAAHKAEPETRPHGWQRLTRLFSGEEEPEENVPDAQPEDAADENVPRGIEDTGELEYCNTEDADTIRNELEARAAALTLRCTLSGILAVALIVLDLMGQGVVPSPAILDPVAAPAAWLGVHLILLGVGVVLALPVLKNGLLGLLPHRPASADALAALAAVAAVLQTAVGLLQSNTFDSTQITMFSGAAALLLFVNLLGQRLAMDAVRDGFGVMTSGVDNATGYCLADTRLLHTLCAGMEEKDPVLLLSRPGSLLKNFMAQSFAPHRSDRLAVEFARTLGLVALVGGGVTLAKGRGITAAVSVMAAILCMGAPLSAALIRAIPSRLMQRAAAQVGAVIPGWPAIEQLGEVDMVQADAAELFPPMCAHLYGIKTFQKERIDLAILYATSILIESCNTLAGLFRNMIENHTDMLYPVKDLEKRVGLGYLAWCDNCRVLLGTRALMSAEGIALPAMDYENRYTQNGDRHVLYLAVSGKLYAMFLYGYTGTKKVAHTLSILRRENIRLLVTADDPTLTETRIEAAYRLRPGFVKVLNGEETAAMAPATAYLPATDGCLVHLGGFASLIGGLQAAAGADGAEHNACTVQIVSVVVSVLLGLLLSFAGGLAHISLAAVLLYQIAWSALSVAITLTKKY